MSSQTTTLTAKDIEFALLHPTYNVHRSIPRYTPSGWWECDVAQFTDTGYFREYEIKISRADFRADTKKRRPVLFSSKQESKHDLLAQHSPRGPVQFWYVTPVGLISVLELPEWAGLIEVEGRSLHEARRAPRLHRTKVSKDILQHVLECCYYRYHHTRESLHHLKLNKTRHEHARKSALR